MSVNEDLICAVKTGNIAALKEISRLHPEVLTEKIPWHTDTNGGGSLIQLAADCNQPETIQFLVEEGQAEMNQRLGDYSLWTPLHFAEHTKAYKAAAMLLKLGADSGLRNGSGSDTTVFCQTAEVIKAKEEIKELIDPEYREKKRQKKIAGTWALTTPKEIVHDHEQPENCYRLTDTFDFEARFWKSVTKDLVDKSLTQTIIFFDDMPEKKLLYQALGKLKECGGDADETVIDGSPLRNKSFSPKIL